MGNATSSVLRAVDPATPVPMANDDGPAFGSLANMGGPRKFKKKPVLILDPEELEKAHMMFQEASAELLGEELERPERPKAVLGLAPIDDEDAAPEDMGESDDSEAGEDDDAIPSAEEVLRMTASRTPAEAPDEMADADEDDFIARQLESLDVDHRIFPSLPLISDDEITAEEEAEQAALEARSHVSEANNVPRRATSIETAYDPELTREPRREAFPVNPLPEPEPDYAHEHAPVWLAEREEEQAELKRPFGDGPFLEFPSGPLQYDIAAASASEAGMEAVEDHRPAFELEPEVEEEAEDALLLDSEADWHEEPTEELSEEYEPTQPEEPQAEPESDSSYTEVEDEPVDGYAFMYANAPRARTLQALADGESNSLRAKLLKERADAVSQAEEAARRPSLLARFMEWVRGRLS